MASHLETKITASEAFITFFNGWLYRQQAFLDQLVDNANNEGNNNNDNNDDNNDNNNNGNNDNSNKLIELVLNHYAEYYEEKARVIWEKAFLLFSPPWLTSFEKSFLWVAGFKPSLVFRLVQVSIFDLALEQVEGIKVLKADIAREERKHMADLAAVQESTGAPPLMNIAKHLKELSYDQV